jgi:hypothetical protein
MFCTNCGSKQDDRAKFCANCGTNLQQGAPAPRAVAAKEPSRKAAPAIKPGKIKLTYINDDLEFTTLAELKQAIQVLKQKKKELGIQKKAVTMRQQQLRAQYTDDVRRRGSKFQGGGSVGRFIRGVQTSARDGARKDLAKNLEPLEKEKTAIDVAMSRLDLDVLNIEAYIAKNTVS